MYFLRNAVIALFGDFSATKLQCYETLQERDEVGFDTYCRIEHCVSGSWLHALTGQHLARAPAGHDDVTVSMACFVLTDDYVRRQFSSGDKSDMSMANLQWTTATLKQVNNKHLFTPIVLKPQILLFFSRNSRADRNERRDAVRRRVHDASDRAGRRAQLQLRRGDGALHSEDHRGCEWTVTHS